MEGGTNFFLRLNGFESNIKSFWKEIQIENDFCDVTLACDNKQIKAHRVIISSFSPILRNILQHISVTYSGNHYANSWLHSISKVL